VNGVLNRDLKAVICSEVKHITQTLSGDTPLVLLFGVCSLLLCVSSCASSNEKASGVATSSSMLADRQIHPCEAPELVALWQERDANTPADFPVGPGDVIVISVPEVEELQKQQIRVASDGTIALPLIGTVEVAGMTENDLRAAISRRLATFMKFPRVELFVERYQARDVAVIGAVQKPGLYALTKSTLSIIDVIGLAGGMTNQAAEKVIVVPGIYSHSPSTIARADAPASVGVEPSIRVAANSAPVFDTEFQTRGDSSESSSSAELEHSHHTPPRVQSQPNVSRRNWIVLDLAKSGSQACLDFPTLPGDELMVPIAGQVMVQGWVKNPGAFPITPGMTVLGAVSAAGGAMFSWRADLLRTDSTGTQTTTSFSLSKLAKGEAPDVPVQSGDVLVVEKSAVGAVPYTVFELFQHFGTGIGFPIP
jgi:protein involved in polysaccharide export with SLBB domain